MVDALPTPVAGGMLSTDIPEFRLHKRILNYEIENFHKLGIDIQSNSRIDSIDKLFQNKYKAVFIGIGAQKGIKPGVLVKNLDGVTDAVEYLRQLTWERNALLGKLWLS